MSNSKTKLYDLHVARGAKMVPFAGYDMPVQYGMGVMAEHLHTRASAGLFDVSHMGQAIIASDDKRFETAARAFEALVPAALADMKPGQQRYTQLLNDEGGIIDDLMVSRLGFPGHRHELYIVINAGRKAVDYAHIEANLPDGVTLTTKDHALSLLALQGPKAAKVLGRMEPAVQDLVFMTHGDYALNVGGEALYAHVSRSGYSGEDGYEISVPHGDVVKLTEALLEHPDVEMIGLGARDSLRLEAGLCLYGHDIDTGTSPVEANLQWSVPKARREAGAFMGSGRVLSELKSKPARRLVGIRPEGRAPAREGVKITDGQTRIGTITSGGFGPTVQGPVAMGYVDIAHAKPGSKVTLMVRGKPRPATIVKLPFVPHNYYRG